MARKWIKTNYPGVRYREHPTRKHGVKKDRYFVIRYKLNGKDKEEGIGWTSEGWTAEKAAQQLAKIKEAIRTGQSGQSLAERREIEKERRKREEKEKEQKALDALTLSSFCDEIYIPQVKQNKTAQTIKTEISYFDNWINPILGEKPLKKIFPFDLERLKKKMFDAGRSPRTIRYTLAIIRQIFNQAYIYGYFQDENPVNKVKKPTVENRRIRFLSREEADKLLSALWEKSPQLHDMAILSLHCGLRAGEIFNLTWNCVNTERKIIHLKDTKDSKKGTRSRNTYMTEKVKQMFQRRKEKAKSELVFMDRKGNKIKEISHTFNRIVKDLSLNKGVYDPRDKVCFHTLRHTFASWLAENGTDLYTIKELLGHSTITMTERYSHLGPNTLIKAIKDLEKANQ